MSARQQEATPVPSTGWFGPFYYNRKDPRFSVPKRWGYGYTFNFARAKTYALLTPLLVLLLAGVFAAVR